MVKVMHVFSEFLCPDTCSLSNITSKRVKSVLLFSLLLHHPYVNLLKWHLMRSNFLTGNKTLIWKRYKVLINKKFFITKVFILSPLHEETSKVWISFWISKGLPPFFLSVIFSYLSSFSLCCPPPVRSLPRSPVQSFPERNKRAVSAIGHLTFSLLLKILPFTTLDLKCFFFTCQYELCHSVFRHIIYSVLHFRSYHPPPSWHSIIGLQI